MPHPSRLKMFLAIQLVPHQFQSRLANLEIDANSPLLVEQRAKKLNSFAKLFEPL
jgi:hypothetical protein